MSADEVQPIRGSMVRGFSGSYSSTHCLARALPDCMAFLAGLKMRARMKTSQLLHSNTLAGRRPALAFVSASHRYFRRCLRLPRCPLSADAAGGLGIHFAGREK